MLYLVLFVFCFLLLIIFVNYKKRREFIRINRTIQDKWSKPEIADRDFNLISSYYYKVANDHILSDSTAEDIDFEKLFAYVDRTNSKIGQQYLYCKLKSQENNLSSLKVLDTLVEQFKDTDLRQALEYELSKLNKVNAYFLHELFTVNIQNLYNNVLGWYIKFAGFLWLFSLGFMILEKSEAGFVVTFILTIVNLYLHFRNKQKIARYVHTLPQLNLLLQVAKRISDKISTPEALLVKKNISLLGKLKVYLSFVSFEDSVSKDPSDIASGIWELFKTFLLIEPAMFIISIDRVSKHKNTIKMVFNYVAHLDFAVSIQSLRQDLPMYSKPEFILDENTIMIEALYHPLVKNCVQNSIVVSASQGVLITGSNMSGKTTFIRSIAINTLLSQTLFTSCTKAYKGPFLSLSTSIRVSDDIESQKSFFQAEATSVLTIIKKSMKESGSLIIIDEIFKGTNTIERVAAAKAILSYLAFNKKFIFVSTHDLELAELLGDEYAMYSFEETVCEQRLVFDYKLKEGVLRNKNGIAILSSLGYPEIIVSEARLISDQLRKKYNM
ncbi:MutS-related protein [Pedobacter sp.]|uniref:MutS-related protein n=1 Tax=Pedobacter sp. TaxID=1411316 RepID=UPI003D7F7144